MEQQLFELQHEVQELRREIQDLRSVVERTSGSCERMDDHITFVNSTYDMVRRPFSLVLNAINRTLGNGERTELPRIVDEQNAMELGEVTP